MAIPASHPTTSPSERRRSQQREDARRAIAEGRFEAFRVEIADLNDDELLLTPHSKIPAEAPLLESERARHIKPVWRLHADIIREHIVNKVNRTSCGGP